MISVLTRLTLLLVLGFTLSGCQLFNKKKNGDAGGGVGGSDSDRISGEALPDRQEGVSFMGSNVDRRRFSPVYFDFDSYSIRASERGKIKEVANASRSEGKTIIIAGFTDERGTPEYNRSLGERRAQAVRSALISEGASGRHLQTVSFGAEMPAESGSSEGAYAKNRRAEFGVVR
jgi:peptidoglycan-associated lipoprotein